MSDPTEPSGPAAASAAGVEHLQAAGREFLSAARSFLDAVEEVVEDRSRLGELAESFTGFLGELADAARGDRTPWGRAVRVDEPGVDDAAGPDPGPTADPDPQVADDPGPPPGRERTGRVRRIPID